MKILFSLRTAVLGVAVTFLVALLQERTEAQINLSGKQDTIVSSMLTSNFTSGFTMAHNAQAFNDTISKYGYGRIPSTVIGTGIGITGINGDVILFSNLFVAFTSANSEKYNSNFWRFGLETLFGYVLLQSNVFRLYPLLGFTSQYQLLANEEQRSLLPAMLNPAQFQEPWRISMTSVGAYFSGGIGADVRWENVYNRLHKIDGSLYQYDMRIGIHLLYNWGLLFPTGTAGSWLANGATVTGLPAINPQGLMLKICLTSEFLKVQ